MQMAIQGALDTDAYYSNDANFKQEGKMDEEKPPNQGGIGGINAGLSHDSCTVCIKHLKDKFSLNTLNINFQESDLMTFYMVAESAVRPCLMYIHTPGGKNEAHIVKNILKSSEVSDLAVKCW